MSSAESAAKAESIPGASTLPARKRVARACDECRLHKSRCDGTKFCATCSHNGRVCSYSLLPSDTKGPNAKIKILQRRLLRAQQVIEDLQKQVPGHCTVDTYIQQDSITEPIATVAGPIVKDAPPVDFPSGPEHDKPDAFDLTLIHSILRSVSDDENVTALLESASTHFIQPVAMVTQEPTAKTFCQLTPYSTMLEIVYAAFSNVFALCTIVPEQDFRLRTQRLYDTNPIAYESNDVVFMPLFFSVLALGMVYTSNLHPNLDYHQILKGSESYSRAAMTTIPVGREYESSIHLQIALCHVLHLLNTSRLDLAHSALQVVCRSFMLRQLIRNVCTHEPSRIDLSDMSSRNIVWTVFYLDMHISCLLKVSPCLPPPGPDLATVYVINTAIYNVANYRRSETTFLSSVSVAMAIELMKLIQIMPYTLERIEISNNQQSPKGKATVRESIDRNELRMQCETWEVLLQAAFTDDESSPTLLMARRQLQMHLHLAQITLYHPSIGTRSQNIPWNHVPRADEFKEEDACVQAAIDAIKYTSSHLEQIRTEIIPWHSAYIVFVSAVTLLTAAVHMNDSDRTSAQGIVNTAVALLSNTSYGSWHAKTYYIQFIQTLSQILKLQSHTNLPTNTSITTRRSSFSSDTSTLIALNDAMMPQTIHPSHVSSHSIPYRTHNFENVRPAPSNDEDNANLASQWGFD